MAATGDTGLVMDKDAIVTITPIVKQYDGANWVPIGKGTPKEITLSALVALMISQGLVDAPT